MIGVEEGRGGGEGRRVFEDGGIIEHSIHTEYRRNFLNECIRISVLHKVGLLSRC